MELYNQPVNIDTELWRQILQDNTIISVRVKEILIFLYKSRGHGAAGGEIARELGYAHHVSLNRIIPDFVKRILQRYPFIEPPRRKNGGIRYWHSPFIGMGESKRFLWILRYELVDAISQVYEIDLPEMMSPDEIIDTEQTYIEGRAKQIFVNVYERNSKARKECLEHYGYKCQICDFCFEEKYGPLGKGIIHVHHKQPISSHKKPYILDPINDLVPVCPNCHAMIHSRGNLFTEQEVKSLLEERKVTPC